MAAVRPEHAGRIVRISGLVQGVGFRPYIWRLASELGLAGHVLNDSQGVTIEVWGPESELDAFVKSIKPDAPPLSRIDGISVENLSGRPARPPFRIAQSRVGAVATGIVADAATCRACIDEVFSPHDRRYRYPFTNCTHCGPRLSIVTGIPYDRALTSMADFTMCSQCQSEYDSPENRRFHAQPNACPVCGPNIWLEDHHGPIACDDPLRQTVKQIREGAIIAIKGIGGFHLACDATNETVVGELRRRKRRPDKPLALMMRDLEAVRSYSHIDDDEAELLTSIAAPIVLLDAIADNGLAASVAPGQDRIGIMLPYTPLHHLLMRELDAPIVMTSGNLSDEPQVTSNADARARLASVADMWLTHDRKIINRLDDSVMRLDVSGPAVLRRARGLAPQPVRLAEAFHDVPDVLAMGGELKSTFCLLRHGQAIVSQYIGDLEDAAVYSDYRNSMELYREAFDFTPTVIAVDQHPDYLSTRWGEKLAQDWDARIVRIQHHHAHMSACLADNLVSPDDDLAVGIILDGLGLGADGTVWGGELLVGGYRDYERVGHFLPIALPGGEFAMREPWRNAVAHLHTAFGPDYMALLEGLALAEFLKTKQLGIVHQAITGGINCPLASSAGRLFDAAAAILGFCVSSQSFEGQTGMLLEALARPYMKDECGYVANTAINDHYIFSWEPMWAALIRDLKAGVECGHIAARFHWSLIASIVEAARSIAATHNTKRIVLSGGVMQNQILADGLFDKLTGHGLHVLTHKQVPANDGGLALGQAITAATITQV